MNLNRKSESESVYFSCADRSVIVFVIVVVIVVVVVVVVVVIVIVIVVVFVDSVNHRHPDRVSATPLGTLTRMQGVLPLQ